jgi:hypothetical protein
MTATLLHRLNEVRDGYARRRSLWRELDAYTTAGDLTDLEAAIARSEADGNTETTEIRSILTAKRVGLS